LTLLIWQQHFTACTFLLGHIQALHSFAKA